MTDLTADATSLETIAGHVREGATLITSLQAENAQLKAPPPPPPPPPAPQNGPDGYAVRADFVADTYYGGTLTSLFGQKVLRGSEGLNLGGNVLTLQGPLDAVLQSEAWWFFLEYEGAGSGYMRVLLGNYGTESADTLLYLLELNRPASWSDAAQTQLFKDHYLDPAGRHRVLITGDASGRTLAFDGDCISANLPLLKPKPGHYALGSGNGRSTFPGQFRVLEAGLGRLTEAQAIAKTTLPAVPPGPTPTPTPDAPSARWNFTSLPTNYDEGTTLVVPLIVTNAEAGHTLIFRKSGGVTNEDFTVDPASTLNDQLQPKGGSAVWTGVGSDVLVTLPAGSATYPVTFSFKADFTSESTTEQLDIFLVAGGAKPIPIGSPSLGSFWVNDTSKSDAITLPPLTGTKPAAIPLPANIQAAVNLSGAEFTGGFYAYPSHAQIDTAVAKGLKAVRICFVSWRMFVQVGAGLDWGTGTYGREIDALKEAVTYATGKGLHVVLDMHDYGNIKAGAIGKVQGAAEQFALMWRMLATEFKAAQNVSFGLMNEPAAQSATEWLSGANKAIAHIRDVGAGNYLWVPGSYWTGARDWMANDNHSVMLGVADPINNFGIEVHLYLDTDSSGTHFTDAELSPLTAAQMLDGITGWARTNGKKLHLGEFGFSRTTAFAAKGQSVLNYLAANKDVWLVWSLWVAGYWDDSYPYHVFGSGPQIGMMLTALGSQTTTPPSPNPPAVTLTFDALPTGLKPTSYNGSAQVADASVATIVNGRLRITGQSGHTYPFASFPVSGLTAGKAYTFSGPYFGGGNGRPYLSAKASETATTALFDSGDLPDNSSGTYSIRFTAPGPTVWVSCGNDRSLAASWVEYDNFTFTPV